MLQGAGNLFMTRARLAKMTPPWFDPAFALTGGEDRDFFLRLSREGARFAWCDEARAYGDVPDSRANLGWALRRAYSIGNSDMRVLLKHRPGMATRRWKPRKSWGHSCCLCRWPSSSAQVRITGWHPSPNCAAWQGN
jgi:hypothetical protein